MKELNKDQVSALFAREAVLLGTHDRVPESRAVALFGKAAVDHTFSLNKSNPGLYLSGYGTGDYTLFALTFLGFQAAVSFYNVQILRNNETHT